MGAALAACLVVAITGTISRAQISQGVASSAFQAARDRGLAAALRTSTWNRAAQAGLGHYEIDTDAVNKAVRSLSSAARLRPEDADANAALGALWGTVDPHPVLSEKAIAAALGTEPWHYVAHLARGVLHGSVDSLRIAVRHHPSRPEGWVALGQHLAPVNHRPTSQQAAAEAVQAFLHAYSLDPKSRHVLGCAVEGLRSVGENDMAQKLIQFSVDKLIWLHPLQRPKAAFWRSLKSSPLPGSALEESCSWCRATRQTVETALAEHRLVEEFRQAKQAPAEKIDASVYVIQSCDENGLCKKGLQHATGAGRGTWQEWSVWDPSRFDRSGCLHIFPKMCDLVSMLLLVEHVPLVRLTLTEVHPPLTYIPKHASQHQGRLRLLCPLDVPDSSISRLRFPGHTEWVYTSQDMGRCRWFDESFEHELHYEGEKPRTSLTIDVPHPSLHAQDPKLVAELDAPGLPEGWGLLQKALATMAAEYGLDSASWANASVEPPVSRELQRRAKAKHRSNGRALRSPKFHGSSRGVYRASELETAWLLQSAGGLNSTWVKKPCDHLPEKVATEWIESVANAHGGSNRKLDSGIFSRWQTGSTVEWIEPLAGILRHPRFPCEDDLYAKLMNKDHLMLAVSTDHNVSPLHTGAAGATYDSHRKVLIDAGVSRFPDSLGWLLQKYEANGIEFDEIHAWEPNIDAALFWREVPQRYVDRLSFYNSPVSTNRSAMHNPMVLLDQVCRPTDFCVLKLDIECPYLESYLMQQLLDSPDTVSKLDEFFWEHQVQGIMQDHGWGLIVDQRETFADSYRRFTVLRELGVRAHSWI